MRRGAPSYNYPHACRPPSQSIDFAPEGSVRGHLDPDERTTLLGEIDAAAVAAARPPSEARPGPVEASAAPEDLGLWWGPVRASEHVVAVFEFIFS